MRSRDQRGVAFPSPVAMLSVIAVAMAGIAYVATQDKGHRPGSRPCPALAPTPSRAEEQRLTEEAAEEAQARGQRGRRLRRGLQQLRHHRPRRPHGGTATDVGWQVVGSDNWYGTIPASTVYFPTGSRPPAKVLALDLGITRVLPAIGSMRSTGSPSS